MIARSLVHARAGQPEKVEVPGVNPGATFLLMPLTTQLYHDLVRDAGVCPTCRGRRYIVDVQLPDLLRKEKITCPACSGKPGPCIDDLAIRKKFAEKLIKGWEGVQSYDQAGAAEPLPYDANGVEVLLLCSQEFDAVIEAAVELARVKTEAEGKVSKRRRSSTTEVSGDGPKA